MPRNVKELQRNAEQLIKAIICDCKIMGLVMDVLDNQIVFRDPESHKVIAFWDPTTGKYELL